MGWGVEQVETFSELIEKRTGMKVLNAAMSSYGTVRELKLLERINTDNLKCLIIQYCYNDILENREYFENKNMLPVMAKEVYNNIVDSHLKKTKYFFGKHTCYIMKGLANNVVSKFTKNVSTGEIDKISEDVELFINALANAPVNLKGFHIVVIETNSFAGNSSHFINGLNEFIATDTYPDLMMNIETIDLSSYLTPDKYFSLDGHMSAKGHSVIADVLVENLEAGNLLTLY